MISFDQVKAVRLVVADPVGFNDLISVPTLEDLPTENVPPQTAYYIEALKIWKRLDNQLNEWVIVDTELSNERIANLIMQSGEYQAKIRSLRAILTSVARKMQLVKLKSGADDMTFISLKDLLEFYRQLIEDLEVELELAPEEGAGLYMRSTGGPDIGGGMLG